MPTNEYGTHKDFMESVAPNANARQVTIDRALKEAFSPYIEKKEVEAIIFSKLTANDLAQHTCG